MALVWSLPRSRHCVHTKSNNGDFCVSDASAKVRCPMLACREQGVVIARDAKLLHDTVVGAGTHIDQLAVVGPQILNDLTRVHPLSRTL